MNHVYRLVWCNRVNALVVVSETTRGKGKGGGRAATVLSSAMLAGALTLGAPALAQTITVDQPNGLVYPTSISSFDNQATIANSDIAVNVTGDVTGDFTNSGTIQSGDSHGIYVSGSLGGNFTNAAGATLLANSIGLDVSGNLVGTFNNAGTIHTNNRGVQIGGNLSGGFSNSGLMHSPNMLFFMPNSSGVLSGNISNTGTMISTDSHGIFVDGSVAGAFTNSGRMFIQERVFNAERGMGGAFSNEGTIDTASEGLHISGVMGGNFTNTGTLRAYNMGVWTLAPQVEVTRYWYDNNGSVFGTYEDLIAASPDGSLGAFTENARVGTAMTGNVLNSGTVYSMDSHAFYFGGALAGDFTNAAGGRVFANDLILKSSGAGVYQPSVFCQTLPPYGPGSAGCYWRDALVPTAPAVSGSIVNAGTVVSGASFGFVIEGGIAGNFTNSSRVLAQDGALLIQGGRLGGDFVNSGLLIGGAEDAIEIYSSSEELLTGIDGNIVNSGKIFAEERGLYINSPAAAASAAWVINGNFTNTGKLGASNCSSLEIVGAMRGEFVNALGAQMVGSYGLYQRTPNAVGLALQGNLTNRGEIIAGDYYAVNLDGDMNGNLLNASTGRMFGQARGIDIAGALTGTFTNDGRIYSGGGDYDNHAVEINGGMTGAFANSANAVIQSIWGNGVVIGGNFTGNFKNDGLIVGNVDQTLSRGDWQYTNPGIFNVPGYLTPNPMVGVLVNGNMTGAFTNSGTIRSAQGVFITGDLTGGWINTGKIVGGYTGKTATGGYQANANLTGYRVLTGDAAVIGGNFSGNFTTGVGQGILVGSYTHNWSEGDGIVGEDTTVNLTNGTGTATLTGATVAVHVDSASYANNYTWAGIKANSIVGFGGTVTDNSSLYNFTATVDANNDLVFTTIKLDSAAPSAVVNYANAFTGIAYNGPQTSFSNAAGALVVNADDHAVKFTDLNVAPNPGDSIGLGSFTNAGRIVGANTTHSAVYLSGDLSGDFTNAATGHIAANVPTIVVTGDVNGNMLNDGEILGTGSHAVYIQGSLNGDFTNSATGYIASYNNALLVDGNITGNISNAGIWMGTGSTSDSSVEVLGNMSGSFSNSGSYYSVAKALDISGSLTGNITNTGDLTAATSDAFYIRGRMTGNFSNAEGAIIFANDIVLAANCAGLDSNVGLVGSISNAGTLFSGESHAIFIKGAMNGSFTNAATGTIFAEEMALGISGELNGNFSNDGEIISGDSNAVVVSAMMTGNFTNAAGALVWANDNGIWLGGWSSDGINGNFSNAGEISAGAHGVFLGGMLGGNFTNASTGVIAAKAIGLYVRNALTGNVNNQGEILSTDSHGVYVGGLMTGNFTNGAGAKVWANEAGVLLSGGLSGSFSNAGSIYGGSQGVWIAGDLTGGFSNADTGTIVGKGVGVDVTRALGGGFTNAGDIQSVNCHGVFMRGMLTGNFTNASGAAILGQDHGVELNGLTGNFSNAGEIAAFGSHGVVVKGTLSGNFTNTGSIAGQLHGLSVETTATTGTYTNTTNAQIVAVSSAGVGVYVDSSAVMGTLNNAGLIAGGNKSLDLQNSVNAFVVNNSGILQGDIYLGLNTLNLDGTLARVIGDTRNTGGTVNVNGEFTSEGVFDVNNFNITPTGTFRMRHPIGGANQAVVSNQGVLDLGNVARSITGTYSQGSGSSLDLTYTDASNYGQLNVSGNATLDNGGEINVKLAGTPGSRINGVVIAGGTLSLGTLTVNDDSALYDFTADSTRNPKELDLITVADPDGITKAAAGAQNPGVEGAASALQFMFNNGIPSGMQPVFDLLSGLSDDALKDALNQMLPAVQGAADQAGLNALRSMNKIIQARIESNQGLSSGNSEAERYLWLRTFGSWADQKDIKGVPGFKSRTGGIVIGGDAPVTDQVRAGGAFTYARSDIKSRSVVALSNVDVDTYELVGYASYNIDERTDANFQVDLGYNKVNSNRQVFGGGVASADFSSLALHGSAGVGRVYDLSPQTNVTPSVRVDYTRMRTNGYTESGATIPGANLRVNASTFEELLFTADAKLTHRFDEKNKFIGNFTLGYDAMNKPIVTTSSFVGGGPTFQTQGLDTSPWLYRLGLGFIHNDQKGLEYSIRLDLEGRPSGYRNNTLSARVRWQF
jgi:hypothetical protein